MTVHPRMSAHPRLYRSTAYWALTIGSIASAFFGAWIVVTKLATMTASLKTGASTASVDVYAGQSWIVFGCALFGAGLVGIIAALALAAARSLVLAPPAEAATSAAFGSLADLPTADTSGTSTGAPHTADHTGVTEAEPATR